MSSVQSEVCGEAIRSIDWTAARAAVDLVEGKWNLKVLAALAAGPRRHSELLRATGTTGKALSRALRTLIRAGVVVREVRPQTMPPTVYYGLDEEGRVLLEPLGLLADWWSEHARRTRPDRGMLGLNVS